MSTFLLMVPVPGGIVAFSLILSAIVGCNVSQRIRLEL